MRYRVLKPCFIDGSRRRVGEEIDYAGPAGSALLLIEGAAEPERRKPGRPPRKVDDSETTDSASDQDVI